MTVLRLYAALGAVDDVLLKRAGERKAQPVRRKMPVLIAACLCILVLGTVISYRFLPVFSNRTEHIQTESDQRKQSEELVETKGFVPSGIIIGSFGYEEDGDETVWASSCYAIPDSGGWGYTYEVTRALEEYKGQQLYYFVGIDIWKDNESLEVGSAELAEELNRLQALGYEVGYAESWTYHGAGERMDYSYAAAYLTEDQLLQFSADKSHAYFFRFSTNGDGTPVDVEQGIINSFDFGEGIGYS